MPESRDLIDRGLRLERAGVLQQALGSYQAAAGSNDPAERSEALRRQADVLRLHCAWPAAVAAAEQALDVAQAADLEDAAAEALNALGAIEQSRGRLDVARPHYVAARDRAVSPLVRACALENLGVLASLEGDPDLASESFEQSLECFRAASYDRGVAISLNNLGRASLDREDYVRAEEVLLEAVSRARLIQDLDLAAVAMVNLAEALTARGDFARADEEASAALGFFKVSGNRWRQVECLKVLGDVRRQRGEYDVAMRLYEQSRSLAQEVGETFELVQIERRIASLLENSEPPSLEA